MLKILRTIRWIISGRVQGVGYRYYAKKTATRFNIVGTVQNLSDGTVEIYARGTDETLSIFYSELLNGPSFAAVSNIEMYEVDNAYYEFEDFFILH